MSTMPIAPAPVKPSRKARPFACSIVSLTIEINDTRYAVDATDPGEFGSKSFRLMKAAGDHAVYDVIRTHAGVVECDCPDYEARHRGLGLGTCKHGRALVELGLLPAPLAPVVAEVPAACCDVAEPAPCSACVEAEVTGPAEFDPESPLWVDDEPIEVEPAFHEIPDAEPEPPVGAVPFADWIAGKATSFRQDGTTAALWLARKLDELAATAAFLGAATPDEFDAREAVLEEDRAETLRAIGHDSALLALSPLD